MTTADSAHCQVCSCCSALRLHTVASRSTATRACAVKLTLRRSSRRQQQLHSRSGSSSCFWSSRCRSILTPSPTLARQARWTRSSCHPPVAWCSWLSRILNTDEAGSSILSAITFAFAAACAAGFAEVGHLDASECVLTVYSWLSQADVALVDLSFVFAVLRVQSLLGVRRAECSPPARRRGTVVTAADSKSTPR